MDPLAQVIADASAWPIQLLDRIAAHAAAIPFAVFHVAPTLPTALAGGVASMALIRATATRRAGPWMKLSAVALVAAAGLPFVTVGSGVLELHMIDVGQGDALALRTPRGRWVLIDAGPSWDGGDAGRRTVIPYVQRRGGPVVLMVLSHAHEDHVGGAASVISALAPRQWWEPAFVTSSSGYRKALAALRARVKLVPSEELQRSGGRQDIVVIETEDGAPLRHHSRHVRGTWGNPMPREEVDAKARDLILPLLGRERTDTLLEQLWRLETLDAAALDRLPELTVWLPRGLQTTSSKRASSPNDPVTLKE
jgi:hypothetical protein